MIKLRKKPTATPKDDADARVARSGARKFIGRKSAGIGDTVAKAAEYLGFEHCDDCDERRKTLNRLFPYHRS